jgi:chromosome segregation ATPase
MTSSNKTSTHSSSGWSTQETSSNFQYHQEKTSSFSANSGGLLSEDLSDQTDQARREKTIEAAEASLKERETRLNEREAELERREIALDAAHERLIGGDSEEQAKNEDDEPSTKKASPFDLNATIEELRQENSKLRAELAAANKRSGRFLSQRAQQDDASGHDRFRLSERIPKGDNKSPGGLRPMGFDPELMAKWKSGHETMSPRMPRLAGSRPDGK